MGTWIQPVLTANGAIGQSDFAVSSGGGAASDAYKAFDNSSSSYVNKMNADAWLMFYVKATISINSIVLSSSGSLPQAGILQISYDEGTTWTQVGSWQDTAGTGNSATVVIDTANVQGNYWRLVSQGKSLAKPNNNADFTNVAIDADVISSTLNSSFDVVRKVLNPALSWHYFNAGTADLLTVSGTTLTNLPITKSATGSAFYQTARAKCFDIPATPEIWIRFDVFTTLSTRWRAYNENSNGSTGICSQTSGAVDFWVNNGNVKSFSGIVKNQLQTVLLHMVTGSSGGIVEAWLDGVKLYTYTGNVNNGEDFADIYLQSDGSGTFFSNVIISNGEISLQDGFKNFSVDTERLLRESQFALVLSASVERRLKNVVSVLCDVTRNVYKPWKYYNPGTADDLLVEGTTVTDLPESKSVTGTAFYQTQRVKCFDIPPSDDIWIKFDAYIEWLYFVGFYFVGNYPPSIPDVPRVSNGIMLDRHPTKSKLVLKFWGYEGSGVLGWADVLSTDTLQTFLLHLKSGRNDGVIEAWVDGELAGRYTGNVNYGKPLNDIAMIGYGGDLLSNVVISNVRIGFEEGFHRFKGFETERTVVNLQRFYFDTLRKIPHKVFVAPLDPLINETTGVQSIQIELAAQQLTDRVTYTSINPADSRFAALTSTTFLICASKKFLRTARCTPASSAATSTSFCTRSSIITLTLTITSFTVPT